MFLLSVMEEIQKEGKKKMRMIGKVEVPSDVFIKILEDDSK